VTAGTFNFQSIPQRMPKDWQPRFAFPGPKVGMFDFSETAIEPVTTRDPDAIEVSPSLWLPTIYPSYVTHAFADRHDAFWSWLWSIEKDERPRPFVGIWPRGGGKSVSAEIGCVSLGARGQRKYALYVCETQDQADKHVQTIAALMETPLLSEYYPKIGRRAVGKYGNPKGWRRQRLQSEVFTVDAIGLDTAARGVRIEEQRPDLIVLDDIDGKLDSATTVQKKIATLTTSLLPAGSDDVAVLFMQNLIHPDSIAARLADARADFLADRIVSGPHPAVEHLTYEQRDGRYVITGGVPTWEGQNLVVCQQQMDNEGLTAFLQERQHKVDAPAGGMFDHLTFRHCRWDEVPDLVKIVVWCDPAVTNTDDSDAHGIQADGLAADGTMYRLWSWEDRTSPQDVLKRALRKAVELKAECVGVETDQGGDTWQSVYREAWRELKEDGEVPADVSVPKFRSAKAGQGHGPKAHRASQMLTDYERGKFVHVVGTHEVLERGLRRFPKTKPYDLVDSAYWSWLDLGSSSQGVFL
jgi:hypothetical protein